MTWSWTELSLEDALPFLDSVRDSENSILFEPSLCHVYKHPLSFYDGYDLIRVANKYSPPFVILDFLSNGENHFYLDGSDFALQTLCKRKSTTLNEDNVLQYIDLYLSYVYERGNSLVYIRDPQDTGFKGSDAMGVHFAAIQQHKRVGVTLSADQSFFEIKTPLLYQNKSVEGVIQVDKKGRIAVQSPLTVSFLGDPDSYDEIPYIHPKADSILEQSLALLSKVETGKRLLKMVDEMNIEIRIMSSPNIQALTTNKPLVYVFMPAAQYTADYHQALVLGGALRDAEQILSGFPRPSLDEPEELYFAINYDKNLNQLCEICKIVEEFETQNISEAVSAMRRIGIEDIYAGYKNNLSPEQMLEIYIQMMKKQGFILG